MHAPRCTTHPDALAGWGCASCGQDLCPDCVAPLRIAGGPAAVCRHCGGLGALLTRPRRIEPYWVMFPEFLRSLVSPDGLVQLLAIGGFLFLVDWMPTLTGGAVTLFVVVTYYLQVVNHAVQGGTRLPEPADFTGLDSVLHANLRFFAITAFFWLPGALYVYYGIGLEALLAQGPAALLDPGLAAVVIAGLLYIPGAIIAAAVADSVLAVLHPTLTLRIMLRLPGQYALTAAVWYALAAAEVVLLVVVGAVTSFASIPAVTPILARMLTLVLPVLQAFVLGRFVFQNAEHFGILLAGQDVEPVLPGATPRGAPLEGTQSLRARTAPAAIEVEGWDGPQESLHEASQEGLRDAPDWSEGLLSRFEAEGPPVAAAQVGLGAAVAEEALQIDAPIVPSPAREAAPELASALAGGDAAAVARLAAAGALGDPTGLDARAEVRLAGLLERAGSYGAAADAYRRAARVGLGTPFAARALFMLGRLHAERLHEPEQARAVWQALVTRFPNDELAHLARQAMLRLP